MSSSTEQETKRTRVSEEPEYDDEDERREVLLDFANMVNLDSKADLYSVWVGYLTRENKIQDVFCLLGWSTRDEVAKFAHGPGYVMGMSPLECGLQCVAKSCDDGSDPDFASRLKHATKMFKFFIISSSDHDAYNGNGYDVEALVDWLSSNDLVKVHEKRDAKHQIAYDTFRHALHFLFRSEINRLDGYNTDGDTLDEDEEVLGSEDEDEDDE